MISRLIPKNWRRRHDEQGGGRRRSEITASRDGFIPGQKAQTNPRRPLLFYFSNQTFESTAA
jgi:hypothetical protein